MNHTPLSPDEVRALRIAAGAMLNTPLDAFVRENSFRHERAKGLNVIRLTESHQLLIAMPGVVRHNWHGFGGWPTAFKAGFRDVVLAGVVALHTFRPQPHTEHIDDDMIALNGWFPMKQYRQDSVNPDYAVLAKDSDAFDSGEGYQLPAGVPVALSFDQSHPTFVFRVWDAEERELSRFSDEGRPADEVGVRYTEAELSRLVDLVAPYLPR